MPITTTNIVRACLVVLAGGFAAQHSRLPVSSDLCVLLFVASLLIFLLRPMRWLACLALGLSLFMHAGNAVIDARLDPSFAGDSLLTRVRITNFPKFSGASLAMIVAPIDDNRLPRRSRVTWFEPPQIPAIGEVWQLELRLRRPRGNSNPGVFSLENWLFREQLHASGYVVAGKRNRLLQSGQLSSLESYRRDFVARTEQMDAAAASVLAAIGVGTRHLISRSQWQRYANTGTSHLMAISGLHIGLAAAAAFLLLAGLSGVCRLRGNHLDHACVGAVGIAAMYALISGFGVPSQRASVMLGLAACAFLCRRRVDPVRIVAGVALLIFVFDPLSLMMPGFSLSFAAVIVLLWFGRRHWRPVPGLRLLQLLTMQFMLLLGLMPLTVLVFQRIAFTAPLVNALAVPVFSFATVPLTLLSMLLHPIWAAASAALLRLAAASVRAIEWLIATFAELPLADTFVAGVAGFSGAVLCIVFLPALWVVLPRGWPGRWVALLAVLALLLNKPAVPGPGCFDTHVLDVGQGLAVLVQTANRTLLFDTGASYRGGGSAAEHIVLPVLRHKGIDALDWLVVSHADDDHAGGAAVLHEQISIEQMWVGEALPRVERQQLACNTGQVWRGDGIEFRFLHPRRDDEPRGNDASCVLAVSAGDYRLILTGDIEAAGERSVLDNLPFESATVVVIPHHGSLTSSGPEFVNRLQPDLAISSVGYNNRWGFPNRRVTKRWQGAGAVLLDTANSGAISLRVCERGGVSRLREERVWRLRFWHDSDQQ